MNPSDLLSNCRVVPVVVIDDLETAVPLAKNAVGRRTHGDRGYAANNRRACGDRVHRRRRARHDRGRRERPPDLPD